MVLPGSVKDGNWQISAQNSSAPYTTPNVMGNPIWDHGPLFEVVVHIVAEAVTQPYFKFCCLQFHHSFYDNVL